MKKRIVALTAIAAALCLAACGSEASAPATETTAPAAEEETTAVTEAVIEGEDDSVSVYAMPICIVGETIDWGADYNTPKCALEEIVENFVLNGVYVGKNVDGVQWMFYEDSIADYEGTNLYSETKLKAAADMMQQRADWCEENGMTFYFLICPNKNTIYPEYMPSDYTEGDSKKMDQVIDYLRENTTVNVVDVRDTLFEAKADNPDTILYYPYDTHWNNNGGFYGYEGLMEVIAKDFPTVRTSTLEDYNLKEFDSYFKDQCYYLGYYDTFKTTSPVYTRKDGKVGKCTWTDGSGAWGQFIHSYIDMASGYRDSTSNCTFTCEYAVDAPSIYVIHDSFFIAMNSFMKDSFSGMSSHWTTGFSRSAVKSYGSDIVLFECVEATLDSVFGQKTFED